MRMRSKAEQRKNKGVDELKEIYTKQQAEYRKIFGGDYKEFFQFYDDEYANGVFCPVCGKHLFSGFNSFQMCPVCGWEDDAVQNDDPDYRGGANWYSVNEYRKIWDEAGNMGPVKAYTKG